MNTPNSFQDKLLRYEQLKKFNSDLESELEVLGREITEEMIAQGADESPPLSSGKIILVKNKRWQYPATIDSHILALNLLKAAAEADGSAQKIDGAPYIKYQKF